jgi:hypothetical protein
LSRKSEGIALDRTATTSEIGISEIEAMQIRTAKIQLNVPP